MTKKNDRENIWLRNNIPALEFCTLSRAAELLGCHLDDLIHFSEIGAIELCLPLHNFEAVLFTTELWEEGNAWEVKHPPKMMAKYINKSPLSLFMPKAEFDMNPTAKARVKRFYQHEDTPGLKKPIISLSGLWALSLGFLPRSFYSALKNKEQISLTPFNLSFKEADIQISADDYGADDYVVVAHPVTEHFYSNGLRNEDEVKPIATITVDDILVTRHQIEKIDYSIGADIPSILNGGVLQTEPSDVAIEKPVRATAKQSDLIVALLRAIGLTDEELKGSISELMNKANSRARKLTESRVETLPFPDDEASTISWLKKGGVNR
ncbi:hypothetical protein [Citrobacter sp. RHBSTW-00271]|uniref:hypothetical protein n=1 Tax=Citrobacter sp. RHBSTW-00271 TaxID=2742642 RepID=UPI0015FCA41F|nr:hypothetical protein [Citrobacter sp. RHBSTW-00271]MBA7944920.1 hypothetical protein [Citrobacter sp. RHBSTW-00271]HEF0064715.1 hypothetical protein [Citrobacter pasteurii]HEF0065087.1 hypothetical protein [Citrobacter pasteurii]